MNTENESKNTPTLSYYDTLVLSGCSSKGIVVLGALQYCYDNFLLKELKNYIGTSSGAIICYLLAIGYTPIEITVYICTHQLMEKMQNLNILAMLQGRGASSFNNVQEELEKMTIAKIGFLPTLNDLKTKYEKNLICVTYNVTEDKSENLSPETHPNLPCITALRMSANLPLIFEKFRYGENFYVDGGVFNNFPIDIGDEIGNKILGIHLTGDKKSFNQDADINTLEFIYKLIFIPIKQATAFKISRASDKCKILTLIYTKFKFFDFSINSPQKLDMFSSGFEQAKIILDK